MERLFGADFARLSVTVVSPKSSDEAMRRQLASGFLAAP
jgi:hypothetical protein